MRLQFGLPCRLSFLLPLLFFQVFLFLSFLSKSFLVTLDPGFHWFPIADLGIMAVENGTDRGQERCPHDHCWSSSWQQPTYSSTRHDSLVINDPSSVIVSTFLLLGESHKLRHHLRVWGKFFVWIFFGWKKFNSNASSQLEILWEHLRFGGLDGHTTKYDSNDDFGMHIRWINLRKSSLWCVCFPWESILSIRNWIKH